MDVKKYEVFVKIVEKSSLTKAAEAMGLTQSGVSHIVAAMESELGVALLRRAISMAPASSTSTPSMVAERTTMSLSSSGE